jgi:N-acetylglucosaminyldiphosphoundecaprenol N-acetyl-beta-D-mannosaminyltransferase
MIVDVVELFGVRFARVDTPATLDLIGEMVRAGRRDHRGFQVATVNVDFLVNAQHDPELMSILRSADLCLADGMPIVWIARLLRRALPGRVAGSDLMPLFIEQSAQRGWKVHVLGSRPEVADRATAMIAEQHPHAQVTVDPGPPNIDPRLVDPLLLEQVAGTEADILCVALGNPKQERFIAAHKERLRIPVLIGVGGSLDMFVGYRRRAPRWMQRVGLEWVYRALQEPARLGPRYFRDARRFLPLAAHEVLAEVRERRRSRA